MHKLSVQSSAVPNAVIVIAVCATSRALAEIAIALSMVSQDELPLPPAALDAKAKYRIAKTVSSLVWRVEARSAMRDSEVEELAFLFYQICLKWVPTNSANPIADGDWLLRVREFVARHEKLQSIACALLDQIPFPEVYRELPDRPVPSQSATISHAIPAPAPVAAVAPPAPISIPPVCVTNSPTATSSPRRDIAVELVARLERLAKAKRLIDQVVQHYRAHKARMKAAQEETAPSAGTTAHEPPQISAPPIMEPSRLPIAVEESQILPAPPIETIPQRIEAVTAPVTTPQSKPVIAQPRVKRVVVHRARNRSVRRLEPLRPREITNATRSLAMLDSASIPSLRNIGYEPPNSITRLLIRHGLSPP